MGAEWHFCANVRGVAESEPSSARDIFAEEQALPLTFCFVSSFFVISVVISHDCIRRRFIASISIVFSLSGKISETAKSLHTRDVVSLDDLMTTSNIKSATCTPRSRRYDAKDSKNPFADTEGPLYTTDPTLERIKMRSNKRKMSGRGW